jgi:hypothetical protein
MRMITSMDSEKKDRKEGAYPLFVAFKQSVQTRLPELFQKQTFWLTSKTVGIPELWMFEYDIFNGAFCICMNYIFLNFVHKLPERIK